MTEITHLRKIIDNSDETKSKKKCQKIAIEVFVCSCQKQYSSFPALYLHSKNKHEISLSISEKKNMVRRTVWSGVNKKYVYEFREDFEEESSSNKRFRDRKRSGISQILHAYMKEKSLKDENGCYQKIGKIITNQLQLCLQQCGGKIYKMERKGSISKIQAVPANLPYMFNYFVLEYQPSRTASSVSPQNTLKFLSKLSEWVHAKGYSPFIAEINL